MSQSSSDLFRDRLYNTDEEGRKIGFFPKKPSGWFYNRRRILSVGLLLFLFSAPWIRIAGEPLLLFNILERKFVVFGIVFWPQDFLLAVIAFISLMIFVILFTVIFGRIWCGWACPQTIFLEMVYRRIEYMIEGDAPAQRKLSKAPMSFEKLWKYSLKHTLFLFIAFLVGNTFLAYLVGTDTLLLYITESPGAHLSVFLGVLAFTGAFYFVFAWFRERACIFVCPYGRLQGVLLDNQTVVISYDYVRGEPRGKISSKGERGDKGDCVDCKLCVAVCPTGIDIRNGTQLECVNCTACIDACDDVMEKVGRDPGLIRYASQDQIAKGKPFKLSLRAKAYIVVWLALIVFWTIMLLSRGDLQVTMLRAPGQTFTETADGQIQNLYTMKIINKKQEDRSITFRLASPAGKLDIVGSDTLLLAPGAELQAAAMVILPPAALGATSIPVTIEVLEKGQVILSTETKFTGPFRR